MTEESRRLEEIGDTELGQAWITFLEILVLRQGLIVHPPILLITFVDVVEENLTTTLTVAILILNLK